MDEQIETLANEIELTKEYQRIAVGDSLSFNGVIGYLELWAKYNSNDSGTNETNYSAQLRLVVSSGYIGNYATTACALTATGIISSPIDLGGANYTSRTLRTITGTIKHNADGTKVVDMAGSIKFSAWGMTLSVSGSAKLPDLHTPPSINSVNVTETNNTLINAGISNDTFVRWLSNKNFNFNVTTYDDANINKYEVYNANILIKEGTESPLNIDFANVNMFGNEQNRLTAFEYYVTDNKNGIGSLSQTYDFIPYFKPTFVNTKTKVRRQGQTSGKAVLNASGSFYNSAIGTLSPICKVYLKHWEKTGTEPTAYTEIPSKNITISENTFEIVDYLIGSAFDYKKSYYVKVYVQDSFYSSEPLTLNILLGKPTWSEFKDRVDFIKATIQGKEVATKEDTKQKYSTEEQVIGTWIDGKPIYRKVLNIGNYSFVSGENTFEHNITNFETLIDMKIRNAWVGNNRQYLWWEDYRSITMDTSKIYISTANASSFKNMFIIIEYTKSTD